VGHWLERGRLHPVYRGVYAGRRWIEADCVWRPQRLIVEPDGHASHATAGAYERDRGRDRALAVRGWRVVRVTWRQLHGEPGALATDLRSLLDPARLRLAFRP
jgi:very-short-patch-repair endonuclease